MSENFQKCNKNIFSINIRRYIQIITGVIFLKSPSDKIWKYIQTRIQIFEHTNANAPVAIRINIWIILQETFIKCLNTNSDNIQTSIRELFQQVLE